MLKFNEQGCTTKLEDATLGQSLMLELLFASGFALTGILINRVGKFPILCEFSSECFEFYVKKIKILNQCDFFICLNSFYISWNWIMRHLLHANKHSNSADHLFYSAVDMQHMFEYCKCGNR